MLRTLYIYDISPFMYAGNVNKYSFFSQLIDMGSTYKMQRTPAGGISLLLNSIRDNVNRGDLVFCTDRNPTIKKDMLESYKCARSHNRDVQVERGVAEYILNECNAHLIARTGYEADDIIYTLIKKCHDCYDNIFVYTGDSDMYFLVDEKVTILPATSTGKTVSRANYETTKIKGKLYAYNTITWNKILHGDASDNIPALSKATQNVLLKAFSNPAVWPAMGDKDKVLFMLQNISQEAYEQARLVFPLDVEDIPTSFKHIDWSKMCCFGNAMHNRNFHDYKDSTFDIEPHVAEMQKRGLYLEEAN